MIHLIKKDIKISVRISGLLLILCSLFFCLPIFYILNQTLHSITDVNIINEIIITSTVYFPCITIPMVGTLVFQTSLNEERKNRIIQLLIASKIVPEKIWFAKMIAAIIVSYISILGPLVMTYLYGFIFFGIILTFGKIFLLFYFIITPVISFSFLFIIGLIMWCSKQGQFYAGFMPMLSYMAFLYLNIYLLEKKIPINILLVLLIALISIIIITICIFIIKHINSEYIANIEI